MKQHRIAFRAVLSQLRPLNFLLLLAAGIVNAVASCSLLSHFDAMRRGMVDFADIGYYVGVMVFMLAAAQVVTDSRKAS